MATTLDMRKRPPVSVKGERFMNKTELGTAIYNIARITGEFKLRSGQISHEYFDKYRFESQPKILKAIAEHMAPFIPDDTEILAGLELGGVPIATALSLFTGIPAVFVRKQAKDYGTCQVVEGLEVKGRRVLMVEDVITTGGQVILSAQDIRKLGAHVTSVACVILREDSAISKLKNHDLNVLPLLTRDQLR